MSFGFCEDLYDEMGRGRIWECHLRSAKWHLDGLQSGDDIYVDPRPAILETVAHELIHRRQPRWGEKRVSREARKIVGAMDERTKQRWWNKYQKVKRKGRPVDVDE